jgi:sugar phosphate isomerase/epimerase
MVLRMTTRRDFIATLSAALVAPACTRASYAAGVAAPALAGVGVQLYMLRTAMRADPEGTVARIAELGYKEIEWWGSWGRTPAQVKAMLDANGLTAPSAHIDHRALTPEQLPALLDSAAEIGHKTLVVASTPSNLRGSADDWKRMGQLLSDAGNAAKSRGIRTGYHNHEYEFAQHDGRTALDILMAESDRSVVDLEVDCFWAYKAGVDPLGLIRQHRERVTMLHLKDSAGGPERRETELGQGVIEWRALLSVALAQRVAHVFVERDEPPDAWASARAGREYLRTLGY